MLTFEERRSHDASTFGDRKNYDLLIFDSAVESTWRERSMISGIGISPWLDIEGRKSIGEILIHKESRLELGHFDPRPFKLCTLPGSRVIALFHAFRHGVDDPFDVLCSLSSSLCC